MLTYVIQLEKSYVISGITKTEIITTHFQLISIMMCEKLKCIYIQDSSMKVTTACNATYDTGPEATY